MYREASVSLITIGIEASSCEDAIMSSHVALLSDVINLCSLTIFHPGHLSCHLIICIISFSGSLFRVQMQIHHYLLQKRRNMSCSSVSNHCNSVKMETQGLTFAIVLDRCAMSCGVFSFLHMHK
jgi:hypothetical protein